MAWKIEFVTVFPQSGVTVISFSYASGQQERLQCALFLRCPTSIPHVVRTTMEHIGAGVIGLLSGNDNGDSITTRK